MSLFEHYLATPAAIDAERSQALSASNNLVVVRQQVVQNFLKAASGVWGTVKAIFTVERDPAYLNADRAAKVSLIASGSLLQWHGSVTTYDAGIDRLNTRYDGGTLSGFGVDADRYYLHGTGTPDQRDAAYRGAVASARSLLVGQLTREKLALDGTLDDDAADAKATLETDPSDAELTKLYQAGLFPPEATLSFSGIDTSHLDWAALVRNMMALGTLPAGVSADDLAKAAKLVNELGPGGFQDAAKLNAIYDLLKGMPPEALNLFVAALPPGELEKWNEAIKTNPLGSDKYRLALSNLMLKGLSADEVRAFMASMPALQPGLGGISWQSPAELRWLEQELGADGATVDQISQGNVGDCWFLAALGAEMQHDPDFVKNHMHDNGNGTYTVTFYHDGKPVEVTVDGEVPFGGGNDIGAHTGPNWSGTGPLWLAIYEKAYASYKGGYHDIDGGHGDTGLRDLTGKDANGSEITPPLEIIEAALKSGHPLTVGTTNDDGFWPWDDDDSDGKVDGGKLVSDHVYIVKDVETLADGTKQLVLINPWGTSGGAPHEVHLTFSEYQKWVDEVDIGD